MDSENDSFEAIKHERINQPDNPCNPSPDYNFANCVEESIVKKVGCQPPWRRFTLEGIPECHNWTQFIKYAYIYLVSKSANQQAN